MSAEGRERYGTSAVGRARCDERGRDGEYCTSTRCAAVSMQAQCMAGTWFELRLNEHTFGLEEPPSAEIGRRRTSKAHGCHARLPPCAAPETENCSCKALAAAGILRRPTVLKELLLPSLLPLLLMMTLMTLMTLLHCRCRCRRCCRGFHCPCCCCGRCGVRWLPPLRASKSAAAVISSGGGGFTARAAAASGRCAGDASGTRRGSGSRGRCVRLLPAASKIVSDGTH